MKLIHPSIHILFTACLIACISSSCNKDYDFSKLDTEIAVGSGLEIATGVKDTVGLSLTDLMDFQEGSTFKTDAESNLSLNFQMDPVNYGISMQSLSINGDSQNMENIVFSIPNVPVDPSSLPAAPKIDKIALNFISDANHIQIDQEGIPGIVKDIMYFEGTAKFTIHFKVPQFEKFDKITIASEDFEAYDIETFQWDGSMAKKTFHGFKINLPAWMKDLKVDSPTALTIKDNCLVVAPDHTFIIESGKDIDIDMSFSGVDFTKFDGEKSKFSPGTPGQNNGRIQIDETFGVVGSIIIYKNDISFPLNEKNYTIDLNADLSNFSVSKARVKLNPDFSSLKLSPIDLSGMNLPDFLSGNAVIDARGKMDIKLNVDNNSPLDIDISTKLTAESSNATYPSITLALGAGNGKEALKFEKMKSTSVNIKPELTDTEEGVSLFYAIPRKVTPQEFKVTVPDEFVDVEPAKTYGVSMNCEINMPLCFGEKLNIDYTYDLADMGMDLSSLPIEDATLKFNVDNHFPFALQAQVEALDANGNVIPDFIQSEGIDVKASSICPVQLSVKATDDTPLSEFKGLRLIMKVKEGNGEQINKNQYLSIKNISITTESGIVFGKK